MNKVLKQIEKNEDILKELMGNSLKMEVKFFGGFEGDFLLFCGRYHNQVGGRDNYMSIYHIVFKINIFRTRAQVIARPKQAFRSYYKIRL